MTRLLLQKLGHVQQRDGQYSQGEKSKIVFLSEVNSKFLCICLDSLLNSAVSIGEISTEVISTFPSIGFKETTRNSSQKDNKQTPLLQDTCIRSYIINGSTSYKCLGQSPEKVGVHYSE